MIKEMWLNMKYISSKLTKYSSLALVLSYMLLHNIYIVIGGIFLSLYELNKNRINNIISYIFGSKKNIVNLNNIDINNSSETIINKNAKNLKLAEEVEELGFIPSKDRNTNAA